MRFEAWIDCAMAGQETLLSGRLCYDVGMRRDDALAILKAHAPELRELGVVRLSLYGSTARDEGRDDSDVDVAVHLEDIASGFATLGRLDLIKRRLSELLQARVDVVPEPTHPSPLKAAIDRESYLVF